MRLVYHTYGARESGLRLKGTLISIVATLVGLFGLFCLVVGVLMMLFPTKDADVRAGAFMAVVATPILAVAGLLLWRAVAARRSARRLRDLAMLLQQEPDLTRSHVAERLGIPSRAAELLLLEAFARGVLIEGTAPGQAPARPFAAPATPATAWATPVPSAPSAGPPAGAPVAEAATLTSSGVVDKAGQTLIGTLLAGTWHVERHLGSGAMGDVYVARHVRTGKRYAVKTLRPDACLSDEALKRFKREAAAVTALGHPGIVGVHDFNATQDGLHFLVMDLLDGQTLAERLEERKTLPWLAVVRIGRQIAVALAAAHRAGIIHRDLKPANVFLAAVADGPERVVLLDFGLAKPVAGADDCKVTSTGVVVGTPMYMSPEQAMGRQLDARSDIFSLGAVLYEMLTGTPPFHEETLARVYARLLSEPAKPPSSVTRVAIPALLDELLVRLLAKDPAQRPPDAGTVVEALDAIDREGTGQQVRPLQRIA